MENYLDMSKVKIYDLSFPIIPAEEMNYERIAEGVIEETMVWPLEKYHSYADDSYCQYIKMKSHVGAHLEAPWHHDGKSRTLDTYGPEQFFGRMVFMNFDIPADTEEITLEMFKECDNGRIREGDIVFTRCKNVEIPEEMTKPIDWYTKLKTPVFSEKVGYYLVEKNVSISPLKLTTHFGEMAYMPVYPVYSWVPVKNTDHYNIDVFKVPDGDFSRTQKIASYTSPQNMDYYDKKAYTDKGLYYFNIQAYDKSNAKIAESQNSYFTVQTDNVKVAALGDSITHGGGAVSTPPSSPLYNWETYAGFPVVNIGFSGNLTADMLKRFDHDVLAFKPKILVVMGGVNDIRTGVKADTVIANLTAIKEKCRKNSIIPVFLTVTSVNPPKMKAVSSLDIADGWQAQREKINKWIKTQDYYVDVAADMTDERGFLADNLTTDGLHPDYEGKKHIGEAVGDYLRLNFEYMLY